MSGFIFVALGLLAQDPAVHPSTLRTYQPPAIRPFEPPSNFGRETEQGDAGELHRPTLGAAVSVDAYAGQYEYTPSTATTAYDQGVSAAERRMDATAGPLDGAWTLSAGGKTYRLVLSDDGQGPVEGGWREVGGGRMGAATAADGRVTLDGTSVTAPTTDLKR